MDRMKLHFEGGIPNLDTWIALHGQMLKDKAHDIYLDFKFDVKYAKREEEDK